ncbi:MAG TPA: glycoside hydrolase family 36 protein, partial [Chloroflexota bacterium]|nr:glycoside hydrolase family 36 protein [Chloroflexota bacterium]
MRLEVRDGRLMAFDDNGQTVLEGSGAARLRDGRLLSTLSRSNGLSWSLEGDEVRLVLRNEDGESVEAEWLAPIVTAGPVLGRACRQLHVGEIGWQSWSRPHPPQPLRPDALPVDVVRDLVIPERWPDSEAAPWVAILGSGVAEPEALLLGFTGARDYSGVVEIAANGVRVLCDTDGALVPPGGTLTSEPLLLALGREHELLERYAEVAGRRMGARHWPRVPTGWCSWYHFFTWVTEADLRRNLKTQQAVRERVPVDVFQLDDGYQRAVGDWLILNDKFPSGMPALVRDIRAAGFTPGIWLAPFLLSANSHTAEHPDWVVRDDAGQPMVAVTNWEADNYALDTTQPEALAWVEHMVRTMREDWGYDYLKIDFIYAGALRGRRHEPNVSAIQAYRRGVEAIRRVAGDRFILGCGAPFLPSIGLVDGMRIGEDVAPYWRRPENSLGPAMTNALHETLLHGWMHRRWWVNDPDCLMARAHDSQLTLAEVQAWAGVVALSGGMTLVSDDLSTLEPDRLELVGRLFPPLGEAAQALPPYVDDMPSRLKLGVERPWGRWWLLGLGNWSESRVEAAFDPAEWDLPPASYHVVDLWASAHFGPATQLALPPLEPHAMHLLAVRPDLSRPRVLGTTGHILADAVDVAAEAWDGAHLRVRVTDAARHRRGDLLVYVPREGVR